MEAALSTARVAGVFGTRTIRYLGIYLASSAGGLQVLDVLSERFGIPDRVFLGTIIVGVLGIPLVAALAVVLDTAAGDRVPAGSGGAGARATPGAGRFGSWTARDPDARGSSAGPVHPAEGTLPRAAGSRHSAEASDAPGPHLQGSGAPFALALVHHRLARMYDDAGQEAEATTQYRRFLNLWQEADSEHRVLVAEARDRLRQLES